MSDWIARVRRGQATLECAEGYKWVNCGLWKHLVEDKDPAEQPVASMETAEE